MAANTSRLFIVPLFVLFTITAFAQPYAAQCAPVIKNIDSIIAPRPRLAYFATLYKTMAAKIQEKKDAGGFTDTTLISHIQLSFARGYLKALTAYTCGDTLPYAWEVALDSSCCAGCGYVQLLALGTNAHINHDLFYILKEYYTLHPGNAAHYKATCAEILSLSAKETNCIIEAFIKNDPAINGFEAFFLRLGKKRVKNLMKKSLNHTWKNAIAAALHPENEAAATRRQLLFIKKNSDAFLHPRLATRKGLKILSGLDNLPFATQISMLQPH